MTKNIYIKPSSALQARIDAHTEWLKTDGRTGTQLISSANFSGLDLEGANLQGAKLKAADFYRANLRGANLRNVDLSGARCVETDLGNANLQEANLILTCLLGANIAGARFEKARTELTIWPTELSQDDGDTKTVHEIGVPTRKRGLGPPL